ncbi:hypothetical protein [Tichowtungia aerotolerans]|uniref:Uncharacterized protein n=1 Tax=Tichowtungia aerotolerans TaxID=2697043 RepID=A0A6P1M106_9BACT|nr:hypothetical protein [Tichowtungia aerotolerans]QHI68479.1 hypothetical protein GT409_03090 [Tichowtungia aerotolerans]
MLKTLLEAFPSLSAPAFILRDTLGTESFDRLRQHWLQPTGSRPKSHPCQKCNGTHRIHWHSDQDIVSIPPADSYCEKQALSFDDACLLRFDVYRFAEQLCQQLEITPESHLDISRFPCRIGWLAGATLQYPVYLLFGSSFSCEQAAKKLLIEEESPFVLFSSSDLPELFPLFKKKKCALLSLFRIAEINPLHLKASVPGKKLFSEFLYGAEDSIYVPSPDVQITLDFKRIIFDDGYEINLAKAHKRRAVVRFIQEHVRRSGKRQFDVEVIRDAYNRQYPKKPWSSDRFKEDLFRGAPPGDFDRIFETIDAAMGKYSWLL